MSMRAVERPDSEQSSPAPGRQQAVRARSAPPARRLTQCQRTVTRTFIFYGVPAGGTSTVVVRRTASAPGDDFPRESRGAASSVHVCRPLRGRRALRTPRRYDPESLAVKSVSPPGHSSLINARALRSAFATSRRRRRRPNRERSAARERETSSRSTCSSSAPAQTPMTRASSDWRGLPGVSRRLGVSELHQERQHVTKLPREGPGSRASLATC